MNHPTPVNPSQYKADAPRYIHTFHEIVNDTPRWREIEYTHEFEKLQLAVQWDVAVLTDDELNQVGIFLWLTPLVPNPADLIIARVYHKTQLYIPDNTIPVGFVTPVEVWGRKVYINGRFWTLKELRAGSNKDTTRFPWDASERDKILLMAARDSDLSWVVQTNTEKWYPAENEHRVLVRKNPLEKIVEIPAREYFQR